VEAVRAGGSKKLVLCFSWFAGGDLDQEVILPLAEAGVPFLEGSETTMLALRHAAAYRHFVDRAASRIAPSPSASSDYSRPRPYPHPSPLPRRGRGSRSDPLAPERGEGQGEGARSTHRERSRIVQARALPDAPGVLSTAEATRLLRAFGIPLAETVAVTSA